MKMEGLTKDLGKMEKFRDLASFIINLEIWLMKAIGCKENSMVKEKL